MSKDLLILKYIPLAQVVRWESNLKLHDIGAVIVSIETHGFKDPPKFEPALNSGKGGIIEGNGRSIALEEMYRTKPKKPPRGIIQDEDGMWLIPVLFGVDAESEKAAEAYGIDHNSTTIAGGDFDLTDHMRMWGDGFTQQLRGLMEVEQKIIMFDGEDLQRLLDWEKYSVQNIDYNELWQGMPEFEQEDKGGIILTIHFKTSEEKQDFHNKLAEVGIIINNKTRSFWYPERPEELRNQTNSGFVYDIKS